MLPNLSNPAAVSRRPNIAATGPAAAVIRAMRMTAPVLAAQIAATGAPPAIAATPGYDRARDLAALVPLWPSEIADRSPAGNAQIVQKLRRALRQERQRGLAGHWAYNLARHQALLRAYRAEVAALAGGGSTPPTSAFLDGAGR